jgi:hypothetical protein
MRDATEAWSRYVEALVTQEGTHLGAPAKRHLRASYWVLEGIRII